VYADDAGNIGEHSVGLAPVRSWTGLLPVSGSGNHDWSGFVPTAELPHFFNPKEGFVATANHKMIPDHYPYKVGYEWTSPYRFHRIRDVIEDAKQENRKLTIADLESLQNDVTSLPGLELKNLVVSTALKDEPSLSGFLRWDGRLTRESSEAALYEVWEKEIRTAILKRVSKGGANGAQKPGGRFTELPSDTIMQILTNPEKDLFGERPIENRDQLLRDALGAANSELKKLMGPDSRQWSWGKLHTVSFRHALDRLTGSKDNLDLGPIPRPGDEYTVNATGTSEGSWQQVSGASYREILDTSNWDQSVAVNTPGQSGQPGSPHYSDLMPLWDAGRYFPLVYSQKAVERETTDRLVLKP
jgi:penicillin amidase